MSCIEPESPSCRLRRVRHSREGGKRAKAAAAYLADKHAGAIAFLWTAQPDIGEYGEAVGLARFGEVPDLE